MNSTQIQVTRNMRGELQAETDIELHRIDDTHTRIIRLTTQKSSRGGVRCWAQVGVHEKARASGYSGFSFAMSYGSGGDYSATLASETTRATEAAIRRVHTAALAAWPGIEDAVRAKYPAPELATA